MARIPLVDHHDPDADPKAVELLTAVEGAQDVGILNVHRALANHPELMQSFFDFAGVAYIANSLEPRQRELPYLTSAMAIECFY